MKTLENQLEQKSSFLPLIGPFLLLASLTLLVASFPEKTLVFACVALLSLAACWQWTWRGVLFSMALLTIGFGYHYSSMEWSELFWHLGISSALILGFVVTALSSEEMTAGIATIFPAEKPATDDSQQLREQIATQNATLKQLEAQLQTDREAFAQHRDRTLGLEQLLQAAREELKSQISELEEVRQEVVKRRESSARALQQMAEAQETVRFLTEEAQSEKAEHLALIQSLKTQIQQQSAELEKGRDHSLQELRTLKTQLEGQTHRAAFLEEEKQAIQREWESEKQETQAKNIKEIQELVTLRTQHEKTVQEIAQVRTVNERTSQELSTKEQQLSQLTQELTKLTTQREAITSQLQALQGLENRVQPMEVQIGLFQQNLAVAEAQKVAHWRALRTAEGKLQQLREQFEEKSDLLHETRKELFIASELAECDKRDLQEWQLSANFYETKMLYRHIQKVERSYETALSSCQNQVEALESLITHFFSKSK